jgi:O-methyltransferase
MPGSTVLKRLFESAGGRYLLDRIDELCNNDMEQRGMLRRAFLFAHVNKVLGDYFEFGVYRGRSFLIAHSLKRRLHFDHMKLWAFDSFAGLPEIDDHEENVWTNGQYACSLEEFQRNLASHGVRYDEYEIVQGFYDRTLNEALHYKLAGRKAAIVNVDCDLYSSTVTVLKFVKRYLANGTVICFDDFYHYKGNPDQGQQKALSQFLEENGFCTFIPWADYSPVGKSFIVRLSPAHFRKP